MASQATGKIPSGVEPIDRVIGGLERGQCHLIIGRPGSGKTTLGAQFLIAGLNNNERVVIFTRLSAQEVVSRFEPLGYDYFAHVPKGSESNDRLIIFEQSDEIVEQIKKLDDFSLVTQELEETLKEHRPARVVFDPASYLIEADSPKARENRARALIDLSNKFHTTSILILDNVSDEGIVGPLSQLCSSVTYLNSKSGETGTSILDFAKIDNQAVNKPEILVSVSRAKGLTTIEAPSAKPVTPAPKPVSPAPVPVAPPPQPVAPSPTELFDTQTEYNPPHPSPTPISVGTQPLPSIELETPHEQKFHVLVIDDDPATCNLITRALRQDCDVTAVNDGASGLKKLSHETYDLIILDVNLPVVDGFHICQHIRKTQWQVPIIIVTGTHLRAEDRLHSASAGGDLYLTKPFSVHELRLRVRQMIGRYRNVPEWVGAGAGIGLEPAISESVSPEPEEQFVGYDAFVQRLSRHTERARAVGLPFSIVGCTIATNGNGSNKMSRMVDAVRYQIRERDVMTVTPEHQSFVLLSEANVDGVQVFVQRLRQSIQAEVGSEPLIQWRTYPIDGENAAELLTEVREELKNDVIAIEKESSKENAATIPPAELITQPPPPRVPVIDDMATFFVPPDPVVEVVDDSHLHEAPHIAEVHVPEALEPETEEPFFEFVIEEEEMIREGDSTMSNMAAHLPVPAHTTAHTGILETPKPPAEPEKELVLAPIELPPTPKEDSLQEFSFEFRDSEPEKVEYHDGTPIPPTTDEIKPQHTGEDHAPIMSESSFTGEIGSVSQIISEADLKAATHHISQPIEHIVEPVIEQKIEPKIEVSHPTPEPEFVTAVQETHSMPPMTHVPETVGALEPVVSTVMEASPASTSPASTWIPAASVPKLPESRVSTPAMWTETPRSAPPVENVDVPTFATFFDNSFEQYRQIVESLNKQPEPVARPVRFEPSARESFLDFLAGRH